MNELTEILPNGLDELYLKNFQRIRSMDVTLFEKETRLLLSLLVTMREPLTVIEAQVTLGFDDATMKKLCEQIHHMFPVSGEESDEVFTVYHKTVVDWLSSSMSSSKLSADHEITVHMFQSILPGLDENEISDIIAQLKHMGLTDVSKFLNIGN